MVVSSPAEPLPMLKLKDFPPTSDFKQASWLAFAGVAAAGWRVVVKGQASSGRNAERPMDVKKKGDKKAPRLAVLGAFAGHGAAQRRLLAAAQPVGILWWQRLLLLPGARFCRPGCAGRPLQPLMQRVLHSCANAATCA